jgi:hypothetical protein
LRNLTENSVRISGGKIVTRYNRAKETVLLRHASRYEPIPERYLLRFVSGVVRMLAGLERHAVQLGAITFSGTFMTRKRLVYWDFFPADTSKARLLYSVQQP